MFLLLEIIVGLSMVFCILFLNVLDASLGVILRDGYPELHARLGKPSGLTTIDWVEGRLRPYRDQLRPADRNLFDQIGRLRWITFGLFCLLVALIAVHWDR